MIFSNNRGSIIDNQIGMESFLLIVDVNIGLIDNAYKGLLAQGREKEASEVRIYFEKHYSPYMLQFESLVGHLFIN